MLPTIAVLALAIGGSGGQALTADELSPAVNAYFREGCEDACLAVRGDFDGDGAEDLVRLEHIADGGIGVVAYMPAAGGERLVVRELARNDLDNVGLDGEPCITQEITIERDAFELVYFEASARLFFWTGERFEVLWTAD